MTAKRSYLGKNYVGLSGMISKVTDHEVSGYRVIEFQLDSLSSYYSKKDGETKKFTQRVPCKFWDKNGDAPIEAGWYVHLEGQIASDKHSGLHVKARIVDRVFEDQSALDEEYRAKPKPPPVAKQEDISFPDIPPMTDEDIPY